MQCCMGLEMKPFRYKKCRATCTISPARVARHGRVKSTTSPWCDASPSGPLVSFPCFKSSFSTSKAFPSRKMWTPTLPLRLTLPGSFKVKDNRIACIGLANTNDEATRASVSCSVRLNDETFASSSSSSAAVDCGEENTKKKLIIQIVVATI